MEMLNGVLTAKLVTDQMSNKTNKLCDLRTNTETSDAKPIPTKVVFASEEQKDAALSKAKNVLRKGKEHRTGYLCTRL